MATIIGNLKAYSFLYSCSQHIYVYMGILKSVNYRIHRCPRRRCLSKLFLHARSSSAVTEFFFCYLPFHPTHHSVLNFFMTTLTYVCTYVCVRSCVCWRACVWVCKCRTFHPLTFHSYRAPVIKCYTDASNFIYVHTKLYSEPQNKKWNVFLLWIDFMLFLTVLGLTHTCIHNTKPLTCVYFCSLFMCQMTYIYACIYTNACKRAYTYVGMYVCM